MRGFAIAAVLLGLGLVAGGKAWRVGISLGGTHLAGMFLECRLGEVGVLASLGSAAPWELRDLSLAFQVRRYLGGAFPVPYLGLGGWAFLVREGDSWGWLTSMDVAAGIEWPLEENRAWELGMMLHYFLHAFWQGEARFNFRTLILPTLAFKWAP